jgi:hypothetical protein
MEALFGDSAWIATGRRNGKLLRSAEEVLAAIGSDMQLCLYVLDAVYGDERLSVAFAARALLDDVKFGRIGEEWDEEREAEAQYSVERFTESWKTIRPHMMEAQLVSLVSAIENYIKSLLVEFPAGAEDSSCTDASTEGSPEGAWQVADDAYRMAVKKAKGSVGSAWVDLCEHSSVPAEVKAAVRSWANDTNLRSIEVMILMRNAIVHNAGIAGKKLAENLQIPPATRFAITPKLLARFGRAYRSFTVAIDPSL